MKIGILGTGFGVEHARIYKSMAQVDEIIIFGRNKSKLEKIEKELDIKITDNIDDILLDKALNLIDICMPSSLHKIYVIEALKNGKHAFCETPVALNLEDALAMTDASRNYGRKIFIDNFIKFEPAYQYLYDTAKSNSLGNLKSLHIKRKTPQLWGDLGLEKIVTSLMIHEFDFVSWLLGEPDTIAAYGIEPKKGQAHVDATLNYHNLDNSNNIIVNIQSSSMMPYHHPFSVGYEADFENGVVEYSEDSYYSKVETSLKLFTSKEEKEIKLQGKNCYKEAFSHVLCCCEKNIPSTLSLDAATEALKIALQVKNQCIISSH